MANELEIPGGIRVTNNVELDQWAGPYASLAAARAAVPVAMRLHRTVKIVTSGEVVDYVWKAGTADGDLVVKSEDIDPATETDYGTTVYADQSEAEAAANEPVVTDVPNTIGLSLRALRYFFNRCLATARAISGVWTAPNPAVGTNTNQIQTAAGVQLELDKDFRSISIVSNAVTVDGNAGPHLGFDHVFIDNLAANLALTLANPARRGEIILRKTTASNVEITLAGSGLTFKMADNGWSDSATKKFIIVGALNSEFLFSWIKRGTNISFTVIENFQ